MIRINVIAILLLLTSAASAQAFRAPLAKGDKQLNVGLGFNTNGLPIYGGIDFAVSDEVTIGPQANIVFDDDASLGIGCRADYHFNRLLEINKEWDVYSGINAGFGIGTDDALELGVQLGGRYYWSDKWGLNLEFAGGNTFSTKLGVSVKF